MEFICPSTLPHLTCSTSARNDLQPDEEVTTTQSQLPLTPLDHGQCSSRSHRSSQLSSPQSNTNSFTPMCSRTAAAAVPLSLSWLLVTLAVVLTASLTSAAAAAAQHQAKVDSSQCSYTLVVNEFDVSRCPVMLADAQLTPDIQQAGKGVAHEAPPHFKEPRIGKEEDWDRVESKDRDVSVLRSQVRELEERLLQEMVRSRELNMTLGRHDRALHQAQSQLTVYQANFTTLYRALVFVQRQLHRQRKMNKSLNKKLSNVMLDVVEVNNVLTRMPTSPRDGAKATAKSFHVQSVAKVRSCPGVTDKSPSFVDCAAVFEGGHSQSGVYFIRPHAAACPVPVWCDMDTPPGGWLVFQRRQDGSVNFNRHWNPYRDGFGSVAGEHWLGNDNLFLLTNQDHYQLRVDLWDFSGNRVHAIYSTFRVAGERDKFQLTLSGHSGSAQDSFYRHNRMAFSTPDRDNDNRGESHCAAEWEAGWWFNNCWFVLLNGAYHNRSDVSYRGIAWNHWKREQLRKTEMKMRPTKIKP